MHASIKQRAHLGGSDRIKGGGGEGFHANHYPACFRAGLYVDTRINGQIREKKYITSTQPLLHYRHHATTPPTLTLRAKARQNCQRYYRQLARPTENTM